MDLLVSPKEYFSELVKEGFDRRKMQVIPRAEDYLVNLLQHYLETRNLFEPPVDERGQKTPQTLAEMYLIAAQLDSSAKIEQLKKLGDRSLYISGYFGESLKGKIVDVDYYVEMGGAAYRDLASYTKDETLAQVFRLFSKKFVDFVDVLTYVSDKAMVRSNDDVLYLYEQYLKTGSEVAREKLSEMGVVAVPRSTRPLRRPF